MGLFSSKKTTKENVVQNSNIDRTTTPEVPDWILQPTQDISTKITDIGNTDPNSYVAGMNPLLDRAAQSAGGLNSQPWNFEAAGGYTHAAANGPTPTVQSASILDNIGAYKSGYENDVYNAALADYDHGAGMTRAQQQLELANDTTFGGSGGSIARSLTEGELARGRGSLSANLRDQTFQRAAALSSEDANRRQQAAMANAGFAGDALQRQMQAGAQLADLSTAYSANERANIAQQMDVGGFMRGVDQERMNAPLTLLDFENSQRAKLNPGLFTGEHTVGTEDSTTNSTSTTKSSKSLLEKAAQAAKIAATVASLSDIRLKTNIRRIGTRDDGLGVYEFEYLPQAESIDPRAVAGVKHVGVMAQEVAEIRPDALIHHPSGFLAVDYGRLV